MEDEISAPHGKKKGHLKCKFPTLCYVFQELKHQEESRRNNTQDSEMQKS